MSIKFEELPFWKKDLINMVSLSFFKGNAIFSIELNILMVCKESASVNLIYLLKLMLLPLDTISETRKMPERLAVIWEVPWFM